MTQSPKEQVILDQMAAMPPPDKWDSSQIAEYIRAGKAFDAYATRRDRQARIAFNEGCG